MPGRVVTQAEATMITMDGRRLVAFAGCNYLGLAHDGRVLETARSAIGRVGLSTSASRETSGNSPEHEGLESEVTTFITREHPGRAGVLLPDGYTANLAAAQALAVTHRHAVIDGRAHASLTDAARAAGLAIITFPHRDPKALAETLRRLDGPAAVLTDGVFTADGSVAPLGGLLSALRDDDALVVDDCHGFCVLGDAGRGSVDEAGIEDERVVITTTLAKGLGCGGGVVIGPRAFADRVRSGSTAYICTTPVSPVVAAAGREALRVLRSEPERVGRVRTNAAQLRSACGSMRWRPGGAGDDTVTPIVAFQPGDGCSTERLSRRLVDAGVYVPTMSYPGGPSGVYFRASVTSEHTAEQICVLGAALRRGAGADHAKR